MFYMYLYVYMHVGTGQRAAPSFDVPDQCVDVTPRPLCGSGGGGETRSCVIEAVLSPGAH